MKNIDYFTTDQSSIYCLIFISQKSLIYYEILATKSFHSLFYNQEKSSPLYYLYIFFLFPPFMRLLFLHPDPLQSILQTLERQHEEEKRCALERQRQMYEFELQQLRQQLTPEKPSHLLDPRSLLPGTEASVMSPVSSKRMRRWSEDR